MSFSSDTTKTTVLSDTKSDEYFNKIKKLKHEFMGFEDEFYLSDAYFSKSSNYKNKKLNYKETLKIYPGKSPYFEKKVQLSFPKIKYNCVYKNVRFSDPIFNNTVKSIELVINGYSVDKIYGSFFNILHYINNIDKKLIPFHFNSKNKYLPQFKNHMHLNIYFKSESNYKLTNNTDIRWSNAEILFDIYEIENFVCSEQLDFFFNKLQYTGEECSIMPNCLFGLDFHNIITHIMVKSNDNEIDELALNLDGREINFDPKKLFVYDNFYFIPLAKSFNFDENKGYGINFNNHMNHPILKIKFKNRGTIDSEFYVLAISFEKLRTFPK
jgi:hypothetical protein